MHLINIQRITCLDDSFFPDIFWKRFIADNILIYSEYALFKSATTKK